MQGLLHFTMWERTGDGLEHLRPLFPLAREWIRGQGSSGGWESCCCVQTRGQKQGLFGTNGAQGACRPERVLPRGSWKPVVPSSSLTRPGAPRALGRNRTLPLFAEVAHRGCAPGKTRPFGWLPGERGEGDAGASLVLSQRRVPSSEFSLCLQNGRQVFGSEGPHVGKHQDQVSQRVSWTGPRERQASAGNVRRESLADSPACLDHAVWL